MRVRLAKLWTHLHSNEWGEQRVDGWRNTLFGM